MYKQNIFNLTPEMVPQANEVMEKMRKENLTIASFKPGPFELFIVKDGTQEAEDRKNNNLILGPIEFDGEQYLITAE